MKTLAISAMSVLLFVTGPIFAAEEITSTDISPEIESEPSVQYEIDGEVVEFDSEPQYEQVPLEEPNIDQTTVNGATTNADIGNELERIDRMGRQNMQQWHLDEIKPLQIVQSANDQAMRELDFAYELAKAEGATKTADTIRLIIANRQQRHNETVDLIQQQIKRQQLRKQKYEMDGYRSSEYMQQRREELQRRESRQRPQDSTNTYKGTEY